MFSAYPLGVEMKVAVLGASGRTGREVVAQGLERGCTVVAGSRSASFDPHPNLEVRCVDVLDPDAVRGAISGCDRVISTIGVGTARTPTTTYSAGVANLLSVMRDEDVPVLAVVSAAPVGPADEHPRLSRHIILPILNLFFGATYADMTRMETLLRASAGPPSWLSLRPPRLVNGPAKGTYRLGAKPIPAGHSITHRDLASALLDAIEQPELHGRASYVAN